jgi:DNA-binding LytR/AlgR family response regulator
MKCIVVDDEKLARQLLEDYLSKLDDIEVLGSFRSAILARNFLQNQEVDLIFLDIQMPDLTGLELLRLLPQPPITVLTTAYKQYALESYELNVIDYLVKPIAFERFLKAVEKAKDFIHYKSTDKKHATDFIFIKSNQKIIKLFYDDILYIEGFREYLKIHTTTGFHLVLMNFKDAQTLLPTPSFLRIHRSFIVNLNKFEYIEGNMLVINSKQIKISATYKSALLEYLNGNNLIK